jgi:hypothetical protein
MLALVAAVVACAAIVFAVKPRQAPRPLVRAAAPPIDAMPSPAPAARSPIDDKIFTIAAAGDTPVIAVASAHRVWISRDDGKTFARALDGHGGVDALFVDPAGRVYVLWLDVKSYTDVGGGHVSADQLTLGIADPDGREHWRELPGGVLPPMDARDGWLASAGAHDTTREMSGLEIGSDAGDSWRGVRSAQKWAVLAVGMGEHHAARFLASRTRIDEEGVGHGLYELAASDDRVATVWSTMQGVELVTDEFPRNVMPCAGFAGSSLYLVHRGRLIAVDHAGKERERELGSDVVGTDVHCAIAGNDRAAYLNIGTKLIRIDSDDLRIADDPHGDFDAIAVDAHGFLLYLAGGCVHRYDGSATRPHELVCGPP